MTLAEQVRKELTQEQGNTEVMEVVSRFHIVRNDRSLVVEVLDTGDPANYSRYTIHVTYDGESVGRGNGGPTIRDAFAIFQWGTLDREVNEIIDRHDD